MGKEVVRQDVVQVKFETTGSDGLFEAQKGMDKLKSSVNGGVNDGLNKLKSSLLGTTNETAKLNSALKKVGGIDNLGNATEDLTLLNNKIEVQQRLCDNLADEYKKVASEMGETSDKALNLKMNLLNQETSLTKMTRESKSLSSAIDTVKEATEETKQSSNDWFQSLKKVAGVSLAALKSGLTQIGGKLSSIAKKAAGAAFTGLKKLASISFKALVAAIGAAATAVGRIVFKSVTAYADYEQLIGGVETLFKGKRRIQDGRTISKRVYGNCYEFFGKFAAKFKR